MAEGSDRLDSWKAIADYLDRDVRTLRRWEELGLPVRRVPGGRGHSVYAFRSDIDAWLKAGGPGVVKPAVEATTPVAPVASVAPVLPPPLKALATSSLAPPRASPWRWIGGTVVLVIGLASWRSLAPDAAALAVDVRASASGLTAYGGHGEQRWQRDFPADMQVVLPATTTPAVVLGGEKPGVLWASSYVIKRMEQTPFSGALQWLSLEGKVLQTFTPEDRRTFSGKVYDAPWALTDFRASESYGHRRIAVAAHHYTWWPGIVTILNDRWQREGTFVHSGWVEGLRWVGEDRLLIAGYNEARQGGMVGLLDTRDINGASPEEPGSRFACDDCGSARPLYYVVVPRSELNKVTGSSFNRASIDVTGDRIIVTTSEVERENNAGSLMGATLDFSMSMQLLDVNFNGRYWDRHRALELEGKITHTRENCPERNGPPALLVWDRTHGWRTIQTQTTTR